MNDLVKIYNNISKEYDNKYKSNVHLVEDNIIGDIIKSNMDNNDYVLDVGCGTGHIITLANLKKDRYLGIDFSEGMILDARLKYPDYNFIAKDITTMNSNKVNYNFDVILAIYGQVNYIGIEGFCDILTTHGTKNVKYLAVIYSGKGHKDYDYTKEHQKYFKPNDIIDRMKLKGFETYVKGFSYYTSEDKFTYDNQIKKTLDNTMSDGNENDCKYLLVSNFKF